MTCSWFYSKISSLCCSLVSYIVAYGQISCLDPCLLLDACGILSCLSFLLVPWLITQNSSPMDLSSPLFSIGFLWTEDLLLNPSPCSQWLCLSPPVCPYFSHSPAISLRWSASSQMGASCWPTLLQEACAMIGPQFSWLAHPGSSMAFKRWGR